MWSNLEHDLGALKKECFTGAKYLALRQRLKDKKEHARLGELRALENAYLYLISYVASNQDSDGWWGTASRYRPLITSHVVRLFNKMGVTLEERWSVSGRTHAQGNLYCATKNVINSFHQPTADAFARWGDDFWDDCYILLALLRVRPELGEACKRAGEPGLAGKFEDDFREGLDWLIGRAQRGLAEIPETSWRGPGFFAAAIELFRHPAVREEKPREAPKIIRVLTQKLKATLDESLDAGSKAAWHERYAWHAGQVLVTWEKELMSSVAGFDLTMKKLYAELKRRQNTVGDAKAPEGVWDEGAKNEEEKVYYTVRALSAFYLREKNPLASEHVRAAHRFLLRAMTEDTPLYNLKACINAIDALDKLFDLRIPDIRLHLLTNLTYRLERLGVLPNILNPEGNELGVLERVREVAGERLEEQGEFALEPGGVNGKLFRGLKWRAEFLDEFTARKSASPEPEHVRVRQELLRFLSSTMTEVRGNAARRLIRRLWDNEGFLNFLPLIEHLSDLEHNGAFFRFYRDHLNHEVLLFALGSYIYFNAPRFRALLDREIRDSYLVPRRFTEDESAREFLFRWKMVSTFHDIGYLFEVAPEDGLGDGIVVPKGGAAKAKKELLEQSFGVVDAARKSFLKDYIKQYVKGTGADESKREKSREAKAKRIAELVRPSLKDYQPDVPNITRAEDLFRLVTAESDELSDAFRMIDWHIKDEKRIPPGLLKKYFDMCRSTDSTKIKRQSFLDHGVMSALVLLKTADLQRFYLRQLTSPTLLRALRDSKDSKHAAELLGLLADPSTEKHLEDEQFYVRFSHVAGAIALHNVYPQMYAPEQCRDFGLEEAFYTEPLSAEGRYALDIEENPLAYLTALADSLQDWDRHSFKKPSFAEDPDEPVSASEVVMGVQDGGVIRVRPLTPQAKKRYEKLAGSFDQYMLGWDKCVSVDTPKALS